MFDTYRSRELKYPCRSVESARSDRITYRKNLIDKHFCEGSKHDQNRSL